MSKRSATVERNTLETQIQATINLDGTGQCKLDTGLPFLEHMLDQVARHGLVDLDIKAKGDLHIDAHHTVEDIGITLGQAFAKAIGDKKGVRRYVTPTCLWTKPCHGGAGPVRPSGPGNVCGLHPGAASVASTWTCSTSFFQGFVNHAMITLHIDNLRGKNAHHQAETVFKAFGRALRMAVEPDPRMDGITPSTKGTLSESE